MLMMASAAVFMGMTGMDRAPLVSAAPLSSMEHFIWTGRKEGRKESVIYKAFASYFLEDKGRSSLFKFKGHDKEQTLDYELLFQ